MNKPDLVETANRGHKAFLKKLKASDSNFPYWLCRAAVNLSLTFKNEKLEGKLKHIDELVNEVEKGFEQMRDLLDDLSEEERDDMDSSQAFFAQTFKGKPAVSKPVDGKEEEKCGICRQSF